MKLTESQELFIEVGRMEEHIVNLVLREAVYDGEPKVQEMIGEDINDHRKRRRYLLRKARAAYNKEMKHETH